MDLSFWKMSSFHSSLPPWIIKYPSQNIQYKYLIENALYSMQEYRQFYVFF